MIIDEAQRELTQAFVIELAKLHAKMDWPSYKSSKLTLEVSYAREQITTKLTFGEYTDLIEHSEFDPLMDEVYRRLGYKDRAEAKIQAASDALRSITDQREEKHIPLGKGLGDANW